MKTLRLVFAHLLVSLIALPALAQDPAFLSRHDAWTAHVKADSGNKTCFAWTKPTRSKGNYTKRGDILAFVTLFKPVPQGDDYYDGGQISIVTGYSYKETSPIEAAIAGERFEMFSQDDTAWAASADSDEKLIGAMKAGSTMVVTGFSKRGTKTTDTYSLKGFTAAYNAVRAACK
ncbi:MAG: hypothetical protein GY791_00925 [Alphaproteobacteria bacterium]|nr:hypothetical protein [Alphaproteobacteria bacterium]